jgi:hypothetical protein
LLEELQHALGEPLPYPKGSTRSEGHGARPAA